MISIHTPLAGSDAAFRMRLASSTVFQSTLPLRGATPTKYGHYYVVAFQSTLPLRGATAEQLLRLQTNSFQSTLPLRGATRVHVRDAVLDLDVISIHTPLAGSDPNTSPIWSNDWRFQSTLPLRGATLAGLSSSQGNLFQSTLPLRGATLWSGDKCLPLFHISIHTPLAGSDFSCLAFLYGSLYFNPHSPCGERQDHATHQRRTSDFNPHSPCGERPTSVGVDPYGYGFQSTLPLRGATSLEIQGEKTVKFQSTLPLRGATYWWFRAFRPSRNFNPHSPCGERL